MHHALQSAPPKPRAWIDTLLIPPQPPKIKPLLRNHLPLPTPIDTILHLHAKQLQLLLLPSRTTPNNTLLRLRRTGFFRRLRSVHSGHGSFFLLPFFGFHRYNKPPSTITTESAQNEDTGNRRIEKERGVRQIRCAGRIKGSKQSRGWSRNRGGSKLGSEGGGGTYLPRQIELVSSA